jgi:hypothetical protein
VAVSAVVASEMFHLFNSRYLLRPVLSRDGLLGNRVVLLAIVVCAALQLAFGISSRCSSYPARFISHRTNGRACSSPALRCSWWGVGDGGLPRLLGRSRYKTR